MISSVKVIAGIALVLAFVMPALASSSAPIPSKPTAVTAAGLKRYAAATSEPIYWAGPQPGWRYELSRSANGRVFVRYIPPGGFAGSLSPYRAVATYPFRGAYPAIRATLLKPGWVTIPTRAGELAGYQRSRPTNVHLAFKGEPYQEEVFAPAPNAAITLVAGGRIQRVK